MSPTLRRVLFLLFFAFLFGSASVPVFAQPGKSPTLQFCFWNVENLFDDKVDAGRMGVDQEFDKYFAKNKEAMSNKLQRLCDVLLGKAMNAGRGPDILALAEVESKRAVELLQLALNQRLKDKNLHYKTVVYLDPGGGRSIATAVLSRVPIDVNKTRLLGRAQRMLKVHVVHNKRELVIMASHWTSRVSDTAGRGRRAYAEIIYRDFAADYRKNPEIDYLVCGDFNDTPEDSAVKDSLKATGDLNKVLSLGKKDPPLFYNPYADLAKKKKGTHYFRDTPMLFDNICLSPGLLDGVGWSYVPKSARIIEELQFRGRPDRFGGPNDRRPWRNRGASDHYPVVVEFRVAK